MLYGSEIWPKRYNNKKRENSLVSVQTMAALRIAAANGIVFAPAVHVTAGIIPVELLAAERMEIYNGNSIEKHMTVHCRENTILKWQRLWTDGAR